MPTLFVIGTPIGNLEDITSRAVRILGEVDFVLAEDTRVSIKILNHFHIKKKIISLHEHSDEKKLHSVVQKIKESSSVALLSDAGTPLVADPGRKIIRLLTEHVVNIIPIPGPSSVTAALSISGFSADQFLFFGFLPFKKGKETMLQEIADSRRTVVFFESRHRIIKTIQKLSLKTGTGREIFIGREMTKKFEQYIRGPIDKVVYDLENSIKIKGEFTIVVSPKD